MLPQNKYNFLMIHLGTKEEIGAQLLAFIFLR